MNRLRSSLSKASGAERRREDGLVPTAPLTNIALLLKTFPDAAEKIDKIVLMGGAITGGNITSTAEFNIWEDPEAAQIRIFFRNPDYNVRT